MPVQPTNDALKPAFDLLASTASEFFRQGRPCLGATLKPKLYNRGFDEKAFHFNKFGDFLRAAERAGHVRLTKTSGGDIAIFPASTPATAVPALPTLAAAPLTSETAIVPSSLLSSNAPIRVRPDLWNAFNSHSDKWVYDPDQDRAFKADTEGWGMPTRTLIPVPSGHDRVTAWMRAFTDQQEPGIKAVLAAELDRGADSYQFTAITHAHNLQRSWRRFHIQQVLAIIESWATDHGLRPKNVATAFRTAAADHVVPTKLLPPSPMPPTPTLSVASPQLNTRLEGLIDNLINDLISLRGLIAIIGPKQP